ncbi:MAG: response regulator [Lutibacter sp.]|nr:response regulator [Lutibacter sp.]
MSEELKVLIIEDHPLVSESYKNILLSCKEYNFHILKAENCGEALRAINRSKQGKHFNLFLIDIQLDASEDLAVYIKKEFPNSKIIILTAIDNNERVKGIIKSTPHDAIMIKTDITPKTLLLAFKSVMNDNLYYSTRVKRLNVLTLENEELLDDIDKKIIFHLSKGVTTKNLPNFIDLKLSMIEKRKSAIKQIFNVSGGDAELLLEAEKRGFI